MRILMCTDGSPYAEKALRFGALIALSAEHPVVVLGVAEHRGERDRVRKALRRDEDRFREKGIDLQTKLRVGHAAEQILLETEEHQYDLLIVGSRGRRGVTRFLLGSTASRLASHSLVPILIVRGERGSLNEILICTGAGKPSEESIEFGALVAKAAGAQVTLLHVMSQLPLTSEVQIADLELAAEEFLHSEAREAVHLREGLRMLEGAGIPAEANIRRGLVVDEIFAEAEEGDYDLIVVGARADRGLYRYLLEDIADKIVTHAQRPVLVVHPSVEE
ncbi:MAG: universal stress protein [Chloroflexota bacterium]|nr:universal stress protein [Chloroflexota bacterium]